MSILDDVIEKGESIVKTVNDRISGEFSGPFFIATFFIFWEIPIQLFSNRHEEKIKAIRDTVNPSLFFDFKHSRFWVVFIVWLFWVFLAPFFSPFLKTFRKWVISKSEQFNKYESYLELKKKLAKLESNELILLKKLSKHEDFTRSVINIFGQNKDRLNNLDIVFQNGLNIDIQEDENGKQVINQVNKLLSSERIDSHFDQRLGELLKEKAYLATILQGLDIYYTQSRDVRSIINTLDISELFRK